MDITIPPTVVDFMDTLKQHGHEVYVVGGAVRNLLLNMSVLNWDFTTNATPEQIQAIFPHHFYHNIYGTVTVKSGNDLFEITPFRSESNYTDNRHPASVAWAQTITDDLSRRDFTMNAIAYDGVNLIDPFGGQKDIVHKIVRTVGDPTMRFQEDALRLMRAVRFTSQLGFLIEKETKDAIVQNASRIRTISYERIRDELLKILASDHPAEGILFLKNSALLPYILPELEACFAVPQKSPKRHHIYDVGTHLIMSLKSCPSKDPITRFAALIHDIGKVQTFHKDEATQLITFHNHEVVGTIQAKKIADRLRLSNEQKEKLVRLVEYHQFTVSEEQTDKAVRRFIRDVGKEYIQDMLDVRTADRIGSGATPTSWRLDLFKKRIIEVQKEPFTVKDLKVNGVDVMKIKNIQPSREVGDILDTLFEKVINKEIANERDKLLHELQKMA